jgi:hypothetical protein
MEYPDYPIVGKQNNVLWQINYSVALNIIEINYAYHNREKYSV